MAPPLDQLTLIDPELARKTAAILSEKKIPVTEQETAMLEAEAVHALSQDIEFGETVIHALARLIVRNEPERIEIYLEETKTAAQKGLNLARMIARYWMPVLVYGNTDMLERFPQIVKILLKKGEYTLKKPFDYLSRLLETGRHQTALAFLGLLADAFSQELPYKLSLQLARMLPQSVDEFPESKQTWQISQLRRVVREDVSLTGPFLKSMEKSLYLLSEDGLRRFVTLGLEKYEKNESLGLKFFSLASKLGVDAYKELLVTVSLPHMREGLNRYLQARTGLRLSVRPLSTLPAHAFLNEAQPPLVCSDGQFIYLPDDISHFENQKANRDLYKCLTRLESAYYEFGTFSFDLDRALELCGLDRISFSPSPQRGERAGVRGEALRHLSDAEQFFSLFPNPQRAGELFTIFEQGRIRLCLEKQYPGIIRAAFPLLADEIKAKESGGDPMTALFAVIGLGMAINELPHLPETLHPFIQKGLTLFRSTLTPESPVEASALLVHQFYPELEKQLPNNKADIQISFEPPFGKKIRFDLHHTAFREMDKMSRKIKEALAKKGIKTYRADIQEELIQKGEHLSKEDLKNLVVSGKPGEAKSPSETTRGNIDLSWFDLKELFKQSGVTMTEEDASPHPAFWYKEWDADLGDYLQRHTRVLDRFVPEIPSDFYDLTLQRRYGLVQGVRRAFELLKPEGLTILRNWVEGDEFDYRALLDFAIDKKAGLMPSDRLYIKRIKQHRDVAVMLLVDLSHSISNTVYGSASTVLDVEKEAIILFCEALEVVGDRFAIAGFSGTGRLSVDYLRIKEFDELVDDAVKARINGMSPLRSTRMGAAIRHATAQLKETPAKVRLMIILGDGFPNDVDYKREYAIADTRKAIAEARSESIHAKAITVNIVGDKRLDDLYGSFHHNVITDVQELPTKLLRIYGALTR